MPAVPLVPYPPAEVRTHLPLLEWASCVELWLLLIRKLLTVSSNQYAEASLEAHVVPFLLSYVKNASIEAYDGPVDASELELRKLSFSLLHRTLSAMSPVPEQLLEPAILGRACRLYPDVPSFADVLETVMVQQLHGGSKALQAYKATLITSLDKNAIDDNLLNAIALVKISSAFRHFLLIGSDFLDAVSDAYSRHSPSGKHHELVLLTYLCLVDVLTSTPSPTSLLMDHLFNLQTTSLMREIVATTPFLAQFRRFVDSQRLNTGRAKPLLDAFSKYEQVSNTKTVKGDRSLPDKGKGPAGPTPPDDVGEAAHMYKMSLVSQVQDLFPELGSAFIAKLLGANDNNVERATASLLDDTLDASLKDQDMTETLEPRESAQAPGVNLEAVPEARSNPSVIPVRRNVFDGDEFDRLSVNASQLHVGKKNKHLTADDLLSSSRNSIQKEAILSALAAIDSDDDERDDTYDVNDVGAALDSALAESDDEAAETARTGKEQILFVAYKSQPDVLKRDAITRRSKARAALKSETAMTDEAIESFAIMLERDPKRLQRLENRFTDDSGIQSQALEKSAWQADPLQGDDDQLNGANFHPRGGFRGRGRAGNVNGPADERSTQLARQRKDAHKGSRANHNRRDQRARKIARGGGFAS